MSGLRVALFLADPARLAEAHTIQEFLAQVAPYCRVQIHDFDTSEHANEESPPFARAVSAAMFSEVVFFLGAPGSARSKALLIALRERSGFSDRLAGHPAKHSWFTPSGRRSLYAPGAGEYELLALALELGCGDAPAADHLRDLLRTIAVRPVAARIEREELAASVSAILRGVRPAIR